MAQFRIDIYRRIWKDNPIPSGCTMRKTCKFADSDSKDQNFLEQESYLRKRHYANLTQSFNDNFDCSIQSGSLYFANLPLQCSCIPPRSCACFQKSLLLLRCSRNKGFVVPFISYCRDSVVKPKRNHFACFSCYPLAIYPGCQGFFFLWRDL